MSTVKAVRGTRDLLPDQKQLWNHVEATARAVFQRYGFGEIRTPVFRGDRALCARRRARKPTSSRRRCTPGKTARARRVRKAAAADPPAREHRRRRARLHRAQAGRNRRSCRSCTTLARSSAASARSGGRYQAVLAEWGRRCMRPVSSGRRGSRRCATPKCWKCSRALLDELGVPRLAAGAELGGESPTDRAQVSRGRIARGAWPR